MTQSNNEAAATTVQEGSNSPRKRKTKKRMSEIPSTVYEIPAENESPKQKTNSGNNSNTLNWETATPEQK